MNFPDVLRSMAFKMCSVYIRSSEECLNLFCLNSLTSPPAAGQPLTSDELLVGSLLLHHLQLLQFNAHEVGEYVMMEPGQFKQSRSVYIGVAIYPTVSFFNHSCEGGVSRWAQWSSTLFSGCQPFFLRHRRKKYDLKFGAAGSAL